jgi:hypothetical protein
MRCRIYNRKGDWQSETVSYNAVTSSNNTISFVTKHKPCQITIEDQMGELTEIKRNQVIANGITYTNTRTSYIDQNRSKDKTLYTIGGKVLVYKRGCFREPQNKFKLKYTDRFIIKKILN